MRGFAVLGEAYEEDVSKKYPVLSRIWGLDKTIQPYVRDVLMFNGIQCGKIEIPSGFQRNKLKRACKIGTKRYGHVVSRRFDINFNPFFYHSCLARAFDFYTVSLGCDLRLHEVVIADASSYEGRNMFRLLLPIARRIILVTNRKKELIEEVEYAITYFGTSVALIEDPINACKNADAVILASECPEHQYIANLDRPMLFLKHTNTPITKYWFNEVDISFNKYKNLDVDFAQGYMEVSGKRILWLNAEKEGFAINNIKRGNNIVINRQ
ncbi:hypothetical protein Q428_10650 [Fervidicella metallireducens AeB]|uniref:Uncharacterized protein n=1 Tax=Fervidicella metallireducens AeB TaxID=1403537 RepID=A0A017RTG4_9CLOT|nr:hypothetical protein [Fervidicella metallireducens]EYE87952.1 hypothetical protein Q428_10650 [Fervidicella metallireducens AeB]